jgi:small-conductance mechanosensitive channel
MGHPPARVVAAFPATAAGCALAAKKGERAVRDTGTHHHGPLAGLGAGAAAVLLAAVVLLLAWHRVAGQVAAGITVLVYVVITVVCGLAVSALAYAVLWLRHRVRHPETLAPRHAAEPAPQAITAVAERAAIEPPRRVYLNVTDDQLAAILRHGTEED